MRDEAFTKVFVPGGPDERVTFVPEISLGEVSPVDPLATYSTTLMMIVFGRVEAEEMDEVALCPVEGATCCCEVVLFLLPPEANRLFGVGSEL